MARSADTAGAEPVRRYDRAAIALHWIVAALMLINVVIGLKAVSVDGPAAQPIIDTHKSVGLTVLGLVLLRILWRFGHRPPPLPRIYPAWERRLAHLAHWSLYVVMLLLPLSGYVHDSAWKLAATHPIELYGLVPFPRIGFVQHLEPALREQVHDGFAAIHLWLGWALYALFALHIAGVLKHHAVDRESEIARMLPGVSRD